MPVTSPIENGFLNKLTLIIEENISNDQFGVSELADTIGMSRSNLLRKVKKLSGLSVSQFIRQVRLKHAMEILLSDSFTVSEVGYKVGFSSTSYFIKCFREYYGYPPGEADKIAREEIELPHETKAKNKLRPGILGGLLIIALSAAILFNFFNPFKSGGKSVEKSIAVLPFINDSHDTANVYLINGLMESLLSNLQKINDLRVVSRTSVEKYRGQPQMIPEIARELSVKYIVEGSGQKLGDKILLHIQLIDAQNDKHLWARQYSRESNDIFSLQREISKDIAAEIEAIMTPEEAIRIEKAPTDNLVAYDYFLQGLDLFYQGTLEGWKESIAYFEKAIEHDEEFARAYADIGIAYYFLDAFQSEKIYSEQINFYADQALLFDPQLPMSLIAKAMFYIHSAEYDLAIPYLEKALEYNPNSALAINTLSDFYTRYIPNKGKYLEYALKGIDLDIAANDSITASFIYLHLSNAFIQSGFIHEAKTYIDRSLNYDPENLFSAYIKAYILYAQNRNLQQLSKKLVQTYKLDSTRLDILQEIGKSYYYQRDFPNAFKYYKPFLDVREKYSLEIFASEDAKIGLVMAEMGFTQESEKLFLSYKTMAENDNSIYKHFSLATYFSYTGDSKSSLEHLKLFSNEDNYFYWILIFSEIDPLFDNIKDLPEFKKIFYGIETKFWEEHQQIKTSLEDKGLI